MKRIKKNKKYLYQTFSLQKLLFQQKELQKMVEGKLNKQLADVSLLKQPFVKDPSLKIETYLAEADAKISSFIRIEVGEGIEVEKKDFAEEVQSQLEG